jgi:hypothetical protein
LRLLSLLPFTNASRTIDMSTAKALGIESILDEIIWYLHAGSCAVEQCRGVKLEFSSILFKDDKCLKSHRKSLVQILTVSKKWFRTTVPHLWGSYTDSKALFCFITKCASIESDGFDSEDSDLEVRLQKPSLPLQMLF